MVGGEHDYRKNFGAQDFVCSFHGSIVCHPVEEVASIQFIITVFAKRKILRCYAGFVRAKVSECGQSCVV